jgi:Asp-tRNA(Asn)/Glu-tRNA(Gln) amidotransferase A subunit family amidase
VISSLRELGMALRSRELSCVEHVADALDRLAADPYNCVITLDAERALATAAERDAELARGEWQGPLHGVAVGVKDLIDVAGLPTRAGSDVYADAPPASSDAPVVARLRAAGAVIVAKLHTHEFAYGPTGDVAATGPARNPRDPSRITGGSSSGSAAAVAAGHLPLTLGTDTGASVRTPAALCGVVGLKPAAGHLSTAGAFPLSETLDHLGLLTADVHSASVAWDVLARPDGTGGGIQSPGAAGARVGIPAGAYWEPADPAIAPVVAAAVERLRRAGADVVEVATPDIDELAATYPIIVGAEAWATHAEAFGAHPERFQPATRERLAPNAGMEARAYIDALRTRRRLRDTWARSLEDAGIDALVLPTTRLRATPIGAGTVTVGGSEVPVRPSLLALTLPFNLTGWAAASVPGEVADGELPVGVQIVGTRLEERGVLRLAALVHAA